MVMEVTHFPPPPICALSHVKFFQVETENHVTSDEELEESTVFQATHHWLFFRTHKAVSKSFLDERRHAFVSWRQ